MGSRVDGKVVIVTGAAGNIGSAGAALLANEGARVILNDISPTVHDVTDRLKQKGGNVLSHVGNVSQEADVTELMAFAQRSHGRIDVLWNNAGPVHNEFIAKDTHALEIEFDFFMATLRGHVGAVFLCSKHAIPIMMESGGGSVINTTSAMAYGGDTVLCAYNTAKAAINSLTQNLATEYGHKNIRCNAVGPGLIPGPSTRVMAPALHRMIWDSQMLDREGEPADIANTVLFLASEESKFLTGQVIYVDGGLTGHQATLADRRRLTIGHPALDGRSK